MPADRTQATQLSSWCFSHVALRIVRAQLAHRYGQWHGSLLSFLDKAGDPQTVLPAVADGAYSLFAPKEATMPAFSKTPTVSAWSGP